MAASVQISQIATFTSIPPAVAKVQISSIQALGQTIVPGGYGYFKRNGAWTNSTIVRKVRINGSWHNL